VLLESPGSLTMEVQDVPALAATAHERGACVILDNTWASPLGLAALSHGVDISVMSLTKHVGGHSDLMMGSATAGAEWYGKLRRTAQVMGQVVSPDDAALALRGLRTMGVRLERETASALALAHWLQGRPEVARVLCPMLPGSPGHEIWQRDFTGGCGLFSVVLKGGSGDDVLIGGGGNDTFAFTFGESGHDVIQNFQVHGASAQGDVVSLSGFLDHTFDDAVADGHIAQSGADVLISDGTNVIATLQGISVADLHAQDFLFS